MLKANLRGQVRQTFLPKWKALLPLYEATMNSVQAIHDSGRKDGKIVIEVERDPGLGLEEHPPIGGFTIRDNGVGFNDDNFDSFNTAYSEYKLSRGGKGLGRFIWLKAFERVEIGTTFRESDSPDVWERKFVFNEDYDADNAPATVSQHTVTGTVVRLIGFKAPYKTECPRTIEQIAQRIVEHFVLLFLQADCPQIELHDDGSRLSLNKVFETDFRATASVHKFKIKDAEFSLHGFRITTPRVSKHRLVYAANYRGVVSDNLEDFIPNLSTRLEGPDGKSFVYLGIVQGAYLSERVNNARTDFDLEHDDADAPSPSLFPEEIIRRSEIRSSCVSYIEADLAGIIASLNEAKAQRIREYVHDEAPQYKFLVKHIDEFIGRISPTATRPEIDAALHRELFQREVRMKQEGTRIIKEADKIVDYEEYKTRLADFMDKHNELGLSALAQYVSHRRIILDFFDRAISRKVADGKYPLEEAVHQLVFPMRTTSDDLPYYQHNLWMLDERLTYHSFVSSDKPLSSVEPIESTSAKRPDLFIFDRKMAFAEGDHPINSIVIVEFKRPQRDDYTLGENPLGQAAEMVELVRLGRFKTEQGRPISAANEKIPAYCYLIADITPSLQKVLEGFDAIRTPDHQGYYGYHRTWGLYYEVLDYNKVLRDAQKRNRVFFERLNLLAQR